VFSVGSPASWLLVGRAAFRVLRDLKSGAKRTGAAPPVVSRPLPRSRGVFSTPHPIWRPQQPSTAEQSLPFSGGELRGTPTEGAWRRPARRLWRCTPPAPRPPVHPHPPGPLRKKMCSRSGCLDAKTRVLVVGVLVSTTYNNLTADALPTRQVPCHQPGAGLAGWAKNPRINCCPGTSAHGKAVRSRH
jgi:hypothetical protein